MIFMHETISVFSQRNHPLQVLGFMGNSIDEPQVAIWSLNNDICQSWWHCSQILDYKDCDAWHKTIEFSN